MMNPFMKSLFVMGVSMVALQSYAQNFDLMPLSGIRVHSSNIAYSHIALETPDGAVIVRNEIPQNQEFSLVVHNPEGFKDSAGWVLYGLEFTLLREDGEIVTHTDDVFSGSAAAMDTSLKSVSLNNTFNTETKPGTNLKIVAKLFDRNGSGYIKYEYSFVVVAATKRLPSKVFTYYKSDSRGMRSTSIGLYYNFFEFKGLEGNNFLYKIKRGDDIKIQLKGVDGWKVSEDKVFPMVNIALYDVDGHAVEAAQDITAKSIGESMSADKKELSISFTPEVKLPSGQFYFAWIQITDKTSKKTAMDLVVKFYVED